MAGKIPWDMLSSEEQALYQRLCRVSHRALVFAEGELKRVGTDAVPQQGHAALLTKCAAARQAYLYVLNRYPEHSH